MKRYTLILAFFFLLGTIVMGQNIWFNEIHYDNNSGDVDETIEVVLENAGGYTLSDFKIFLYNGNGGTAYDSVTLDQYTQGSVSGSFTFYTYNYTANGGSIQNGAPDGFALSYQGTLVAGQFLSYEGTFSAVDGPAAGQTSTDIGQSESSSTPIGNSLQLGGTGTGYSSFTWEPDAPNTFGSINTNQSFGGALPATQLAIVSINGGQDVYATLPFDVTVQARDVNGNPANVTSDESITLSLVTGSHTLGGNLLGTILSGTNQVTISGVTYSQGENGVVIRATGSSLGTDDSDPFLVHTVTDVANLGALRAGNMDSAYHLTGEVVLTFQQNYRNQKYIQDATAAILIDDLSGVLTATYDSLDGITGLYGYLNEYGNMLQFTPLADSGSVTSNNNTVTVQDITIDDLNTSFDDYESELVRLLDVTFADDGGTFAVGSAYTIGDDIGDSMQFRTSFYDADYIGTIIPGNVNLTGLPNARQEGNFITARSSVDIEFITPPSLVIDFSADVQCGITGLQVNFSSSVAGGTPPYTYAWDLDGDGNFNESTDENPSFTYDEAGTFDVSLRVTDDASVTRDTTKVEFILIVEEVNTNIIINEVDADTEGTDALEFIELYDGGSGNTALTGLVVVLFNGSDDASYDAIDLTCYSTDVNGYFLIGNEGVPGVDIIIPSNGIQNGADAVALYQGSSADFPNDTPVTTTNLIDAIVYDTDDPDDVGLLPLLNANEPQVNENGRGDKDFHSSQRFPNSAGGQRNTSNYDQSPPTPKAANVIIFSDWTGDVDTDWDNFDNWHLRNTPGTGKIVTIPDTLNDPVITTAAVCDSIRVLTGGNVTLGSGGTLTVGGTTIDSGSTISGEGKMEEGVEVIED